MEDKKDKWYLEEWDDETKKRFKKLRIKPTYKFNKINKEEWDKNSFEANIEYVYDNGHESPKEPFPDDYISRGRMKLAEELDKMERQSEWILHAAFFLLGVAVSYFSYKVWIWFN